MHDGLPLWQRLRTHPRLADRDAASRRFADFKAKAGDALLGLLAKPRVGALAEGIADHSPYLWRLIEADPERLHRLLEAPPDRALANVLDALPETLAEGVPADDEPSLMRRLRRAKQEVALLVALADLGGIWDFESVVEALSRAADRFIATALAHVLRRAHDVGKLRLRHPGDPQNGCRLAVLGLGKLGGGELNYSSDVDLVVVFDAASPAVVKRDEAATLFVRVVRDVVRLLQQPTAEGYVLRVDLRLRPDPGSTAVAINIDAAFVYYEAFGQNWERAAMIKARPVAGDLVLAQTFIAGLAPFVWRRYFDYAAIADIHAMKRQIHAAKGHAEIAVAGHNIKLGRGGIREIEFFVQTQQLIFGGKRPALRGSRTLPMLRELQREGWIGAHAVADLSRAYVFLRRVEHRLQMIADEQTHRLPRAAGDLERFARFCGFASADRFAGVLTRHLRCVVHHYALLFENAPGLDDAAGSLVFTGVEDDPETIETLVKLAYASPTTVARTVREWHSGQRVAVRSARAREALTDLVPKLLVTFARASDPDAAVGAFDKALAQMPAAGELFAILNANAPLRTLFGEILGSAPRLAQDVILRPHLLDAAIGPRSEVGLDEDRITTRLSAGLNAARTAEELLDAVRDLQHEEHFLIGVRLLSGDLAIDAAPLAYSALAVGVIRVLLGRLIGDFEAEHGRVPGAAVAVVAMGKLGSREMTAASDLDLVLLYDYDAESPQSDGVRPLHATQYYARLMQRLLSYLTVATRRGKLYQVDMRLRPSGNQGPLATKLAAFRAYQLTEARTWERLALTRARVVAGDATFSKQVTAEIAAVLTQPPGPDLEAEVRDMRALIEREKPAKSDWDLKLVPGGLIDIEFVAQYLVLRYAWKRPDILDTSTEMVLEHAKATSLLDAAQADRLIAAHRLYASAMQIMRLALEDSQSPVPAGDSVKNRIAAAAGCPDFARLTVEIATARHAVREIFLTVLSG